ncbi:MAG: PTS sugar transporter subunit IIA [Planctomycetota bacterium]
MLVQDSLAPQNVEILDGAVDAGGIITRMARKLSTILDIDRENIVRAVLAREKTRTTAFTNGAAIPHCRLPGIQRFGIALIILRQPIKWDKEGHAVDTIMMIAGPTENVSSHLRILANSSQLLDCAALREKLKQAPDNQAAYNLIAAVEQAIEQRRSQHGMLRELRRDQQNGSENEHLTKIVNNYNWPANQ